ncbi:MAG: NAD-dependent epimerase/dehydratase family protein [Verrucomicrobiae bacterium]|nr:NAD-dependent epimerase/dehydratase family protein [Verrucomicrobiae bacterium]
MRILVLGGTRFIGRQIVETLLTAGHAVSILTRGKSADELPAAVERLRGDRDEGAAGLQALTGRSWDACVDVSGYTARQVRASAEFLQGKVKHYVFVSTMSVYGDAQERPVRETHPRLPPAEEHVLDVNGETYGPLKVMCENIIQSIYGDGCAFLRPQIVAGPHDHTGRYGHWVQRAGQAGAMLAPGDGTDHVQVIDVRDLARFTVTVIEQRLNGAFNMAGPRMTWAEFMKLLGARDVVWAGAKIMEAAGVGERELPLYRPERGTYGGLMDASNERARAAGLVLTSPEETLRAVRADLAGRNVALLFPREREAEILGIARQ